jgi:hypothetical protein
MSTKISEQPPLLQRLIFAMRDGRPLTKLTRDDLQEPQLLAVRRDVCDGEDHFDRTDVHSFEFGRSIVIVVNKAIGSAGDLFGFSDFYSAKSGEKMGTQMGPL